MLGILSLLSCLGAVFCGGIGFTEPFLQQSLAGRTSIAYGNNAFLARYAGIDTPFAGYSAISTPFAAEVAHGAVAAPLAAYQEGLFAGPIAAHAAVAAPYTAAYSAAPLTAQVAHTATVAPVAAYSAQLAHTASAAPVTAYTAQLAHTASVAPVAAVSSPIFAARTAVAAPLAAISAPLVASAPVVSSVEHVPGVAQVPVTKYEAQPALIQNVVDVANPKLATRKFEIRRPAIQKQFYDIEERVVVRPAGSAVVELDQPISKNQRGPTVVSPAAEPVAPVATVEPIVASAPIRALPVGHAYHAQAFLPSISSIPLHSYPIHGPVLHQPVIPSFGSTPVSPQPQGPSTTQPESEDQPQSDDSESVSVENPEFGRSRTAPQQQRQDTGDLSAIQIQDLLARFRSQAEVRAQQEIQSRARIQAQQQLIDQQQQTGLQQQTVQQQPQQQQQQQQQPQQQQQQSQASFRGQQASSRQSIEPASIRESGEVRSRTGGLRGGGISGGFARFSEQVQEIPSVRNLPQVELSNQARLIALLTERGPVSELRASDGLDGLVRARVISATPAPTNGEPEDEKVSTRRVVVNRPIQTVQEVDVVQPFTKIERLAVQQPALIKTARLGIANVPTAVPVHTYTHAHYAF